jgi:hypothetical protein
MATIERAQSLRGDGWLHAVRADPRDQPVTITTTVR